MGRLVQWWHGMDRREDEGKDTFQMSWRQRFLVVLAWWLMIGVIVEGGYWLSLWM